MIDFEIVTRPRHAINAICQVFRFEADQGHIIKRHRLRRWMEDMRLNAILRDADWLPTSLRLYGKLPRLRTLLRGGRRLHTKAADMLAATRHPEG